MVLYERDIRLNTANGVNKYLARVMKMLMSDEIEINKARTMAYIASVMFRGFEIVQNEQQIEFLLQEVKMLKSKK